MSEQLPAKWQQQLGILVLDPDGWREDGKPWDEPIDEAEFRARAARSTSGPWPQMETTIRVRPGTHSAHNLWLEEPGDARRGRQIMCVFDKVDSVWTTEALTSWLREHRWDDPVSERANHDLWLIKPDGNCRQIGCVINVSDAAWITAGLNWWLERHNIGRIEMRPTPLDVLREERDAAREEADMFRARMGTLADLELRVQQLANGEEFLRKLLAGARAEVAELTRERDQLRLDLAGTEGERDAGDDTLALIREAFGFKAEGWVPLALREIRRWRPVTQEAAVPPEDHHPRCACMRCFAALGEVGYPTPGNPRGAERCQIQSMSEANVPEHGSRNPMGLRHG